jgi:hypothetical protein
VIVLATVLALLALGIPFWRDVWTDADVLGNGLVAAWHLLCVASAVVCFLKGKWTFAALGLLMWPFGVVGALRLARPSSLWARKFYPQAKQAEADARYPEDRRMPMWFWQRAKKGAAGA